jgi:hypothetical protein
MFWSLALDRPDVRRRYHSLGGAFLLRWPVAIFPLDRKSSRFHHESRDRLLTLGCGTVSSGHVFRHRLVRFRPGASPIPPKLTIISNLQGPGGTSTAGSSTDCYATRRRTAVPTCFASAGSSGLDASGWGGASPANRRRSEAAKAALLRFNAASLSMRPEENVRQDTALARFVLSWIIR